MAHPAVTTRLTADEFLAHPLARERGELVGGEIRMMTPDGGPHGTVVGNLFGALHTRAVSTPLIWAIDPDERLVTVIAADAPTR